MDHQEQEKHHWHVQLLITLTVPSSEYLVLSWFKSILAKVKLLQGACTIHYIHGEIDSIGSATMESGTGNGDSEVQRNMLELLNQLDGFEASNKIKEEATCDRSTSCQCLCTRLMLHGGLVDELRTVQSWSLNSASAHCTFVNQSEDQRTRV